MTNVTCDDCPLSGPRVEPCIPTVPQLPVLFVGEAPGQTEIVTGVPFTGGAGKVLYSVLQQVNINKKRSCFANVVQCRPPENREPTESEIKCCRPKLQKAIDEAKPELIVALGKTAARVLTGRGEVQRIHGAIIEPIDAFDSLVQPPIPVLVTIHPAFAMRQRQWLQLMVGDLRKIERFLVDGIPKQEFNFTYDPDSDVLYEYLFEGEARDTIAFDTETTGLDYFNDRVIGISFSRDEQSAMAVTFAPEPTSDPRWPVIKRWLSSPARLKCAQNGAFDWMMIKQTFGVDTKGLVYDTRLAEHLLHSDLPANLESLRALYTDMEPYKPGKKAMENVAAWNYEELSEYACKDAVCTYQVMINQSKELSSSQYWALRNLTMPAVPIVNTMTRSGICIDRPRLAVMYANIAPRLEELEQEVWDQAGVSITSPKQITKRFGLKSSNKEVLAQIVQNNSHLEAHLIAKILEYRGLDAERKVLLGMAKRLKEESSGVYRLHTIYNLDATRTGRLSSTNPNLQNIMKDHRILFCADGLPSEQAIPSNLLVAIDFKQVELHVAGLLSNCTNLLDDLNRGVDIHSKITERIMPYLHAGMATHGMRGTPISGELQPRTIAKAVVFGTLYGATPNRFAAAFGITTSQAEQIQREVLDEYPEIRDYVKACHDAFKANGYVYTPWGRVRRVDTVRQAINTPIQSSAADVTLSTMLMLYEANFDLRLNIHDEIVMQMKNDDTFWDNVRHAVSIFTRPIDVFDGYAFKCDVEYGETWGTMEEVDVSSL